MDNGQLLPMKEEEKRNIVMNLVRDRLPGLVLYARQWDHDAAEDIVQDAFLKLHQQTPFPAEPVPWLFAVVRNLSNNFVRSQKRRKKRETERPLFHSTTESDAPNEKELIDALQSLEQEQREIITAKIWGGLSFEQIAEIYGTSKSRAHRKYQEGLSLLQARFAREP